MTAAIQSLQANAEVPAWHAGFLALEPVIRRTARITFRNVESELREEMVAEVVANTMVAYASLFSRGKVESAFASPLARFGICQVLSGRRVGSRRRIREVMSAFAQHHKGFQVERLDYFDEEENCWQEALVEDKRATPADIAACRIDFANLVETATGPETRDCVDARWRRNHERHSKTVRTFGCEDLAASPMVEGELGGVSGREDRGAAAVSSSLTPKNGARHGIGRGGRQGSGETSLSPIAAEDKGIPVVRRQSLGLGVDLLFIVCELQSANEMRILRPLVQQPELGLAKCLQLRHPLLPQVRDWATVGKIANELSGLNGRPSDALTVESNQSPSP